MDFRSFLNDLDRREKLIHITDEVSHKYEIAKELKKSENALLFEKIHEKEMKVAGNIFGSRDRIAMGLGVNRDQLIDEMRKSISNPKSPSLTSEAPVQEVVEEDVNLRKLPILRHYENDGGPYVTSSTIVAKDLDGNRNLSFHRLQLVADNRFAVRLVPRDLHKIFEDSEEKGRSLEIAAVLGVGAELALAAATSASSDVDEYKIAGALSEELELTKCQSVELEIPARAEIVMEGKLLAKEWVPEGPFTDVTGTYDVVRQQPVFQVDCITRRKDAIYPAILPGGSEHQLLMGLPREPMIFEETEKVADIKDVALTPGGCRWLHAVVSINKQDSGDGRQAIEAAFKAHSSLKHVVVVDSDIDIYDSEEVEWAIATRCRADRDVVIKSDVEGSSLDPTADPMRKLGSKMGIDATKDLDNLDKFERAQIPK
ncbi:hypothetical protein AKJ57_00505 [candidate division MSBL1 archaeon SCGC-AAA259A05]|uniref:Anhydromevalonate phosphate decarboxylase n=1 Tax=candidate division MSBL1 archaeon SCGC-AAA259A05 TaxID=1698259 RepID=A0A133UBM9_9EURY|nr:hypothetical protein AKJ57_00505 [candidate division MSBL1 archaeon SCGC-AAA259A05]